MNVSRTAYFTSDYLDKRKNGSKSTLPSRSSLMSPRAASPLNSPSTPRSENPDELDEALTPAHLNYLYKKKHRSVDYSDYYSRAVNRPKRKGYVNDESSSFQTEEFDLIYENVRKQPKEYDGYYIDQKRRYEEAEEIKPKMFTHKTFMDVFDKDQDERFNPIDVVFDDPERMRELEKKQKLSRAVKNVQKKVGINDYNSYDYYIENEIDDARRAKEMRQREAKMAKQKAKLEKKAFKLALKKKKKEEKEQDLFVEHVSDDSDDEAMEGFLRPPENENLKKAWKRKWKNAKKALGDDYFDSYNREREARQQIKSRQEDVGDEKSRITLPPSGAISGAVGPNENFHPLWNYILSWLVYTPPINPDPEPSGKIVELDRDFSTALAQGKKKKQLAPKNPFKNYKSKLKKWNEPASAFLPGGRGLPDTLSQRTFDQASRASSFYTYSELPEEIELSDDGELGDEIIMGESLIEPYHGYPPTSSQAMITKENSFGRLHEGGPVKIVSNINLLIKSIKIMKIIFAPIDIIAVHFPSLQTVVILIELVIFMWILYELSLLIDALCMAIKAVCAPMIAIGKFMNRIM